MSEAGLATFQQEGIGGLTTMKEKLIETKHPQSRQIQDRHSDVLRRYHLTVFLVSSPDYT